MKNADLDSIVDFGTELFEGKVGHNPIVAWVTKKTLTKKKMTAVRLVDYCYSRRDEKETEYFNLKNRHYPKQETFFKIPGMPIAYWVSNKFIELFKRAPKLKSISRARSGAKTGNNELFLRLWWEVENCKFSTNTSSYEQCVKNGYKWYPHNKGGNYRNWYGNNELIINFFKGGYEIKKYGDENNCAYD